LDTKIKEAGEQPAEVTNRPRTTENLLEENLARVRETAKGLELLRLSASPSPPPPLLLSQSLGQLLRPIPEKDLNAMREGYIWLAAEQALREKQGRTAEGPDRPDVPPPILPPRLREEDDPGRGQ
jgi:hypothetical protein